MEKKTQNRKNSTRKNWVYNLLLIVFAVVFVVCVWRIAAYYLQKGKSEEVTKELESQVLSYEETTSDSLEESSDSNTGGGGGSGGVHRARIPSSVDFETLKAQNSEVVAWLFNENGIVNYPVMQAADNEYYLNHLIDGSENINGSLFLHFGNAPDFSDKNTLLFGHSMKNGTMFACLLRYRNQSYYNNYPCFYLYTPNGNYRLDVFAAYETLDDDRAYSSSGRISEGDLNDLVAYMQSRSSIATEIEVSGKDRIVSLSTCAYSSDNARFIVAAKLVSLFEGNQAEPGDHSSHGNSLTNHTEASSAASSASSSAESSAASAAGSDTPKDHE